MIKMDTENKDIINEKELDELIKVEEITEVDVIDEIIEEDKVDTLLKDKKNRVIDHIWEPKTALGTSVKNGLITDIDELLDSGKNILEVEIVDYLLPNLETDLLLIGQSKGKFGGGQRRVFRQTQKKTREGNKPQFATIAIVGDKNGHIGIGYGKSRETVPAREKAIRRSKLNIFKIRRGSGSWESSSVEPDSIPFKVYGKCGSTEITLIPAPKGTGLCVEKECAKILELAGIKNVWSKTRGHTNTKINLIKACEKALKQLSSVKILPNHFNDLTIVEGSVKVQDNQEVVSDE
jgi:small subunit ribosomal protein S5